MYRSNSQSVNTKKGLFRNGLRVLRAKLWVEKGLDFDSHPARPAQQSNWLQVAVVAEKKIFHGTSVAVYNKMASQLPRNALVGNWEIGPLGYPKASQRYEELLSHKAKNHPPPVVHK